MTTSILTSNDSESAAHAISSASTLSGRELGNPGLPTDTRVVIFKLAGLDFAVPLSRVQRIVPMAALSRPPGLPPMIAGFLNLEGTAVSVLRLDRLFNLAGAEPELYSALLLIDCQRKCLAWLVDSVSLITDCPAQERMPTSAEQSFNGCCEAEVVHSGQTAHLLSPDRVLLEEETQAVANFQAVAQQRLDQLKGGAA